MKLLEGIQILSLAVNIPGPVAVNRLRKLGGAVQKIEPPGGDPLAAACPSWYRVLHEGIQVQRLNLKTAAGQARLEELLPRSDLLVTASRPAALRRLGLEWSSLADRYPQLCQVAIVGHSPPEENKAGHDLTYQAGLGLLEPPGLPRTLLADLAGAEQAISAALGLLFARERARSQGTVSERFALVPLADAAAAFAEPLRHGLTGPGGLLGGLLPGYNVYRTKEGWLAVAALEPHFFSRVAEELGLAQLTEETLAAAFITRPAEEWEAWAVERDLPLAAVREEAWRPEKELDHDV